MRRVQESLKELFTRQFPVGDLPLFLAIIFFMMSVALAIQYKSALVFKIAMYCAGGALFYALVWMSFYNHYIAKEMRQIKKRFFKNPQS